jgi:hypothetical protein
MAAEVERNPAESSGVQRAARRAHCGHTGAEEVVRAVQRARSNRPAENRGGARGSSADPTCASPGSHAEDSRVTCCGA